MNIVTKSAIVIQEKDNILVVDSRLIAIDLGIEHASILKTIKKYLDRLERKNPVRFEICVVKRPQGGTYEETYCYLNEQQANLLMTFSRNTDQVLDCKERLVEAFIQAKQIIPAQSDRIRELELVNENLKLQNELSSRVDTMASFHGVPITLALLGRGDCIVREETVVTEVVEPATGKTSKILTADQLKRAVKKRTGQNLKSLKDFADSLREAGRDDLLIPVTRSQTSEYPIPERLDEAISVVYGKNRQKLIGE